MMDSYRKYVKKEFTVLEIGSSNKERTLELSKYCRTLIGVEYTPERCPNLFGILSISLETGKNCHLSFRWKATVLWPCFFSPSLHFLIISFDGSPLGFLMAEPQTLE